MADDSAAAIEQDNTTGAGTQQPADQSAASEQNQDGEGAHYIDFDKLPPEVHARFKRLYKHTKDSERRETLMAQQLRDAFQQIEDLRANVTSDKKKDVLTDLKAQKVAALETGDYRRVADIDERIAEVAALEVKPRKVNVPQPTEHQSAISDEDGAAFEAWAHEKNADGSFKRPWAANTKHPDHQEAAHIGAAVLQSSKWKDRPIEEQCAEIDRRMGLSNATAERGTSVLSSNSGSRPAGGKKPNLSADEKRIAERMYDGLPAAKAHERYLASKSTLYAGRA